MQKELLVLQCDVNRVMLTADWQRLRSPENWMHEAGNLARRHLIWTAALAAGAGVLAVNAVSNPGSGPGGMGRLGKFASMASWLGSCSVGRNRKNDFCCATHRCMALMELQK